MASRYATAQAVDVNGNVVGGTAAVPQKALATNVTDNGVASSVITLNDNTTDIEIAAAGSTVVARWIARNDTQASVISAAGTANFDFVIPAGGMRRAVIPIERLGSSSIVGANIANGLYNRIAYKSSGIGSILTTEY